MNNIGCLANAERVLHASEVRTYQTHKPLGFGGTGCNFCSPVWKPDTCGSRMETTKSQLVEEWRNVEEVVVEVRPGKKTNSPAPQQIWKGGCFDSLWWKSSPSLFILTARFRGEGKVLALSPSQLKPLNHLQQQQQNVHVSSRVSNQRNFSRHEHQFCISLVLTCAS